MRGAAALLFASTLLACAHERGAAAAASPPGNATTPSAAPAPAEPAPSRRCLLQLKIVINTLSYTGSKAHPDTVAELRRLADEIRAAREHDPAHRCEAEAEPLLRELGVAWARHDHMHLALPSAEEVLRLHAALFPDSIYASAIAYALGTVIGRLTACHCLGDPDPSARWREAADAFRRAQTLPRTMDPEERWGAETLPLSQAAVRGEALARAYLTGSPPDRWPGHFIDVAAATDPR